MSAAEVCSVCRVSRACIVCCRTSLCLLHAYGTKHAQHPSLWRVTDAAERERTRASVDSARARAMASIERDLAALEASEDAADRERADAPAPQLEVVAATTGEDAATAAAADASPRPIPRYTPPAEFYSIIAPGETHKLAAAVLGATCAPPAPRSSWFDDDGGGRTSRSPSHSRSRSASPALQPPTQMFLLPAQVKARAADEEAAEARARCATAPAGDDDSDAHAAHFATLLAVREAMKAREVEAAVAAVDSFGSLPIRARAAVAEGVWARLRAGVDADAAALTNNGGGGLTGSGGGGSIGQRSALALAKSALAGPTLLRDFARAIEAALWDTTDGIGEEGEGEEMALVTNAQVVSPIYSAQARVLMTALGDARNGELRARIVGGELSARALATLDSSALAPAAAVRGAEAARARAANETDLTAAAEATWGEPHASVRCPQCTARGGVQMREGAGLAQRDIRKAEIWGGAAVDMSSTDLRCTICTHAWNVDALGMMMLLQNAQLSLVAQAPAC